MVPVKIILKMLMMCSVKILEDETSALVKRKIGFHMATESLDVEIHCYRLVLHANKKGVTADPYE